MSQLPGAWPPPITWTYASWGRRVAACLIDFAPGLLGTVVFAVGYVELIVRLLQSGWPPGLDDGGVLMVVGGAMSLLALVWTVYNRWLMEGRSGQSVGKRTMKISLVSLQTGGPIGPTNALIRDLAHLVDGFAYIGYLWPLWDDQNQTFADKIMHTVVVQAPAA